MARLGLDSGDFISEVEGRRQLVNEWLCSTHTCAVKRVFGYMSGLPAFFRTLTEVKEKYPVQWHSINVQCRKARVSAHYIGYKGSVPIIPNL